MKSWRMMVMIVGFSLVRACLIAPLPDSLGLIAKTLIAALGWISFGFTLSVFKDWLKE